MDTTIINTNNSATASEGVTALNNLRLSKDEVQQKSDAELLQMIEKATGHTGKDFQEYMSCDFSYTYLTGLIKDRGYENGWHKTSEGTARKQQPTTILMKKSEEEVTRQSYMIERSVAEEWKQFNKHVPYKTVTLGWALRRFMADVKSGRIKFELEI